MVSHRQVADKIGNKFDEIILGQVALTIISLFYVAPLKEAIASVFS
ncbi:hypothetical protein [Nostoc sp. LPT]|nr:hypothetical protein [Nostoc sp. LPT]MBN4006951.1 hypothetical protein [Nostoc sp. LPT]